jgi:Family of unknown function (DUF6459)
MRTSRPAMPGDTRSPTPQAAMPTPEHETPDPHATSTGPRPSVPTERPSGGPGCPGRPGGRRPLPDPVAAPDPVAVRLCRIPDTAPPYDGEAGRGSGSSAATRSSEADGAGEPAGRPAQRACAAPVTPPGWPSRFAQVLAETLAGSRPPGQIVPWTTEMARAHIQRLGPQLASGLQPRVRRVVTFHPTSDVMEMTVVVGFGPRVRALAVRLERASPQPAPYRRQPRSPGWLCTAVEAA